MREIYKIGITIRSFDIHGLAMKELEQAFQVVYVNTSGKRLTEMELIEKLKGVYGAIAGTEQYTAKVLRSSPHLKVISRVGVGLDTIDLEYAKKCGITVLNTPQAPVEAVAEHTIALLFSVFKHIPQYNERVHRGDYSIQPGRLISGKTIGIIGLGRIGRKVATFLEAHGSIILYYDPWVTEKTPDNWIRKDNLHDILDEADVICLHSSPTPGNQPILDRNAFSQCKQGVVIINTARGSLIDEDALVSALDNGIVSSAGLDVVSTDPYRGPLLKYPQVVMTPHVASNTIESRQQMEIEAVQKLIKTFEETIT